MNVLVYAGKEVLQPSLTHLLTFLQLNLSKTNSVQTINLQDLKSQPWSHNCAALVLPRCQTSFPPETGEIIGRFLTSGGSVLVFAAAARLTQHPTGFTIIDTATRSGIELDLHASGDSRQVRIQSIDGDVFNATSPESSAIVGFESSPDAKILARFEESNSIAGIHLPFGAGKLVVWCADLDIPLTAPAEEQIRTKLLQETLAFLGLQPSANSPPAIHPHFLTYISDLATGAIDSLPRSGVLKDSSDTFSFHSHSQAPPAFEIGDETRYIIIYEKDQRPLREQTPLFDLDLFFRHLAESRKRDSLISDKSWSIGEVLLYGQVVTSTQTMLERNPLFLSLLPTPFVFIASHQLQGRGRGSNVWVSPTGCLQVSILLRVPMSALPSSKLVFVQYLFALAVVEACYHESILGSRAHKVRLKWPNDLYLSLGDAETDKKKIGGILVNTSFTGGFTNIIIGCGLNVTSPMPLFSLSAVAPDATLGLEQIAAAILAKFDKMWNVFLEERGSFDSFMSLYLERWLHSDQPVTLTTTNPPTKVRICGITPDHGLLRTLPENAHTLSYIDLQPDGNSFDIMAGLIKSKT